MNLRPVLRRPYEMLRRPVSLVDARLPSHSPLRTLISIALGLSDELARRVIGDQASGQARTPVRPQPAPDAAEDGRSEVSDEVEAHREAVLEDVHKRQEHT